MIDALAGDLERSRQPAYTIRLLEDDHPRVS